MDFIIPLLEDLGMDFIGIAEMFLDHPDRFDEMEKEAKGLTDRAAARFMGKLVYLFEGKEAICEGSRRLISPHYHGGLYQGSDENAVLWSEVQRYIEAHYDTEYPKCVYISGDGAGWIKT